MRHPSGIVLFLSHDASLTGAPIFLLRMLRWFREHSSFESRVLLGQPGALSSEFANLAAVYPFQPSSTLLYRALRRVALHNSILSRHHADLRERLSQTNIRLVYVNSVASAPMLDLLSFLRCPVICHVHELAGAISVLDAANGMRTIELLEKRAARYIAVSSAVERSLMSYGVAQSRVQVIRGFVPIPEQVQLVSGPHASVRLGLNIPREAKIVCGCGSIEFRKGTDLFVQVAAQVRSTSAVPVHFIWVGGDAASTKKMCRRVGQSRMGDFVHFVGRQSNVAAYFDAADLFLLTSREDPFPLVMLEAALCGKPVVCFDNSGGAPEFVGKEAGFVTNTVNEMSDCVIRLLSSPDLCTRLGAAARQKVLAQHDLATGASQIAAVIEDALVPSKAMAVQPILPI
jgi:glycosyltransferase involved in cell wall biosynthesis